MSQPLRGITAGELARRLRKMCEHPDSRFAFFLGAGCSVSSGIPDAASLLKKQWLPRLRDLRNPERQDLDKWAKEQFPDYDPANPLACYGDVMRELFLLPEEQQREIEALCESRFPGFGYAVLAGLMTMDNARFNVVLTTNFDDLIPDALNLYTQARPLVVPHESIGNYLRPTRTRPPGGEAPWRPPVGAAQYGSSHRGIDGGRGEAGAERDSRPRPHLHGVRRQRRMLGCGCSPSSPRRRFRWASIG